MNAMERKFIKDCIQVMEDMSILVKNNQEMLEIIKVTNKLVADGAVEGFNPLKGDWANKLFLNQQALCKALKENAHIPNGW